METQVKALTTLLSALGAFCLWEFRVFSTNLDILRLICSVHGCPSQRVASTSCPRSDRFWLLELRVSRTFLDQLRPRLSGHGYPVRRAASIADPDNSLTPQRWIGAPDFPSEWAGTGLTSLKRKRRAFEKETVASLPGPIRSPLGRNRENRLGTRSMPPSWPPTRRTA